MKRWGFLLLLSLMPGQFLAHAEVRVPAFTAYLDPDGPGARVSSRGVTGWDNPQVKVLWFGEIKSPGKLDCSLRLRLPEHATTRLRLTVAGQSRVAAARGRGDEPVTVSFDPIDISAPGYQRFTLEAPDANRQSAGNLEALVLDGSAAEGAFFNLKRRRNAASVHLSYPVPPGTNVEAFYCEVTAEDAPIWSYFMACGWRRGYMGMQVNSPTERRIIFSVWDSGGERVDRQKVKAEDRVTLVAKGPGVYAGGFGNEGTGGHSHLVYNWKTGEKQRFIITAKPVDATHTIYSGYYYRPDEKAWMLISSWKAPKDGGWLHGLYSFNEDFVGDNGYLRRKALFGNQWIRTGGGKWIELTTAGFSCDPTGRRDRLDRFMGVENGQFFLSNGGFIPGSTRYGEKFTRPAVGTPPSDIVLPSAQPQKSAQSSGSLPSGD